MGEICLFSPILFIQSFIYICIIDPWIFILCFGLNLFLPQFFQLWPLGAPSISFGVPLMYTLSFIVVTTVEFLNH